MKKKKYKKIMLIFNNIKKFVYLFFLPIILTACGGGGGGGGAAGGGVGTGVVTNCNDSGTAFQTSEYNNMSSVFHSVKPLTAICASSAYAAGATGNGIQIAVVDSGVDADHSDINANMASFTTGSDTVNNDNDASDDNGHGSHVAGIIAAEKNNSGMHGVAYDAQIYAFKAFDSAGSGTAANIASALDKVKAINEIDIINNSWGTNADCTSAASCRALAPSVYDSVLALSTLATPKISVFAAGNDGEDQPSAECQTMAYNSDISAVSVCVVAVSHSSLGTDNGYLADFSNKCGKVAAYCLAAPGDRIYSLTETGSYTFLSGTSMAAPMVSGGLALIKEKFSSLTPAQAVSRLLATANDSGEYSQSSIYGHGLMNLNAATASIGSLQTINGSNLLDDPNTSYNDLVNNSFLGSAAFSKALNKSLKGVTMEVYDSFDRANFKVNLSSFFGSLSYVSNNTAENHLLRLKPKNKDIFKHTDIFGSYTSEFNEGVLQSTIFKSEGNIFSFGYNQTTNNFDNYISEFSNFFNDRENVFGNKFLTNPYQYTNSNQDYFMSFNNQNNYSFDAFANGTGRDLGLAFNFNPLQSGEVSSDNLNSLEFIFGVNFEKEKFLNTYSSGIFATGDLSNTNYTGIKYLKNFKNDFTFIGSGFAGYTHIDKAKNSYINKSTPLLTSSFTLGLSKDNFYNEDQKLGFYINQPQRVEKGSINFKIPTTSNSKREVSYTDHNIDLEPDSRQINLDLVFSKKINELTSFNANLTHIKNADHSKSSNHQNFISFFYKKEF